jgi:hypothetical protein
MGGRILNFFFGNGLVEIHKKFMLFSNYYVRYIDKPYAMNACINGG